MVLLCFPTHDPMAAVARMSHSPAAPVQDRVWQSNGRFPNHTALAAVPVRAGGSRGKSPGRRVPHRSRSPGGLGHPAVTSQKTLSHYLCSEETLSREAAGGGESRRDARETSRDWTKAPVEAAVEAKSRHAPGSTVGGACTVRMLGLR